ncbi:MAG: GNAT family N-acetyltransferase [Clostridia bacterium]|nr:GNAT family N-acetyltransferase [Clostridia bacterium]
MNESVKFITSPDGEYLKKITELWSKTFGDDEAFVSSIIASKSYAGAVCAESNGELIGMAHLIKLENQSRAYYLYAVATAAEHRGKGICSSILNFLKTKSTEEKFALLLHPADKGLAEFYNKNGFSPVLYFYEISCSGDGGNYFEISCAEYKSQRDFQFGGNGYFGFDEDMLSLSGLKFIGFDIDGEYMCAAVSVDKVCEVCAPPHMLGKAAKRAANSAGKILMLDSVPIGAEVAVMAYNAVDFSYFNLFLD